MTLGLIIGTATAAAASCEQSLLSQAADRYIATQSTANLTWLEPLLSNNLTFFENGVTPANWTTNSTLTATPLRIDRSHSIYDLTQCAFFTELIATDPSNPHEIGAQVWLTDGQISKIDRVVTTTGDWLFNATGTLYYALGEDWSEIPKDQRNTRETIQAAADAYFDIFKNASVVVPWGTPCDRLEGGAYTGQGLPTDSCDVGVIQSYDMPDRRYVIDERVGVVSVLLEFGSIGNAPDSHEFRVENGTIRYIHTMTYCAVKPNCGFSFPTGPTPPTSSPS